MDAERASLNADPSDIQILHRRSGQRQGSVFVYGCMTDDGRLARRDYSLHTMLASAREVQSPVAGRSRTEKRSPRILAWLHTERMGKTTRLTMAQIVEDLRTRPPAPADSDRWGPPPDTRTGTGLLSPDLRVFDRVQQEIGPNHAVMLLRSGAL